MSDFAWPHEYPVEHLLVAGSREGFTREFVHAKLDELYGHVPVESVMHGGARGIDTWAGEWAEKREDASVVVVEADWGRYGRAAGPLRNGVMVDHCTEACVFWDGESPGTHDTLVRLRESGKLFVLVGLPPEEEDHG